VLARFLVLAAAAAAGTSISTAFAQPAPAADSAAAPATPTRGLKDRAELEAFVDGLMTAYLADKHIAGATVSVVKDGQLFFAKGYGWADVAKRIPVDPEKTLFRIGSVSKLFTWTAIMQLVEQGKLDLKTDINQYLDFQIPATYSQPITLTEVLTHTPGLEEDGRDLFTEDPGHITPMGKWLPAHLPGRVRPPGTFSSYSNWATAAAGYIVERKGGEATWDDYIEKHILAPLGMTQTTGRQPLPESFGPDMSQGYEWKNGDFVARKWEIVTGAAPAGSMSASATDMAKFMIAHLNGGALGEGRILSPETTRLMHTRLHGHDPRIPGFAHGFYEQSSHGLRLIGHGGDTQWFHSDLALIPSENVGLFISTNTSTGSAISFQPFLKAFLDHYYPEDLPVLTPTEGAKAAAKRYAGEYLFNRSSYTTYQKVMNLFGAIPIRANEDGSLNATTPFGAMRLVSVDSLLFRDAHSGTLVAFRADEQGNITHGFLDAGPMMAMEKQSTLSSPGFHRNLLILAFVTFAGILIAVVVRFFGRNAPGRPAPDRPIATGRRLMAVVALAQFGFVAMVAAVAADPSFVFKGESFGLKAALALPVLGLVLTLGAAWVAVTQWRSAAGTMAARIRHVGAVLIALGFFWSLNTWNLLGWRF